MSESSTRPDRRLVGSVLSRPKDPPNDTPTDIVLRRSISNPRFAVQELRDGDEAVMLVDARAEDGARVQFTLERWAARERRWIEVGSVTGQVAGRKAEGRARV